MADSAHHLSRVLGDVPILTIGAIDTGGQLPNGNQAAIWGSLFPATWSLCLALRARGLGSAWTSLHLQFEREIAGLLVINESVHQGVLLPIAYTKGTGFRPAPREPLDRVVHVNGW